MLCRSIDPTNWLYTMSRHFVWLTPLANLLLFSLAGVFLAVAASWGRSRRKLIWSRIRREVP